MLNSSRCVGASREVVQTVEFPLKARTHVRPLPWREEKPGTEKGTRQKHPRSMKSTNICFATGHTVAKSRRLHRVPLGGMSNFRPERKHNWPSPPLSVHRPTTATPLCFHPFLLLLSKSATVPLFPLSLPSSLPPHTCLSSQQQSCCKRKVWRGGGGRKGRWRRQCHWWAGQKNKNTCNIRERPSFFGKKYHVLTLNMIDKKLKASFNSYFCLWFLQNLSFYYFSCPKGRRVVCGSGGAEGKSTGGRPEISRTESRKRHFAKPS